MLDHELCEINLNLDVENKFYRGSEGQFHVHDKNRLRERICGISHVVITLASICVILWWPSMERM